MIIKQSEAHQNQWKEHVREVFTIEDKEKERTVTVDYLVGMKFR